MTRKEKPPKTEEKPAKSLGSLTSALDIILSELFDFDYLKEQLGDMKTYIKASIDKSDPQNVRILYRFIKSMK